MTTARADFDPRNSQDWSTLLKTFSATTAAFALAGGMAWSAGSMKAQAAYYSTNGTTINLPEAPARVKTDKTVTDSSSQPPEVVLAAKDAQPQGLTINWVDNPQQYQKEQEALVKPLIASGVISRKNANTYLDSITGSVTAAEGLSLKKSWAYNMSLSQALDLEEDTFGIPKEYFEMIASVESGYRADAPLEERKKAKNAQNPHTKATSFFQLMPSTFRDKARHAEKLNIDIGTGDLSNAKNAWVNTSLTAVNTRDLAKAFDRKMTEQGHPVSQVSYVESYMLFHFLGTRTDIYRAYHNISDKGFNKHTLMINFPGVTKEEIKRNEGMFYSLERTKTVDAQGKTHTHVEKKPRDVENYYQSVAAKMTGTYGTGHEDYSPMEKMIPMSVFLAPFDKKALDQAIARQAAVTGRDIYELAQK